MQNEERFLDLTMRSWIGDGRVRWSFPRESIDAMGKWVERYVAIQLPFQEIVKCKGVPYFRYNLSGIRFVKNQNWDLFRNEADRLYLFHHEEHNPPFPIYCLRGMLVTRL